MTTKYHPSLVNDAMKELSTVCIERCMSALVLLNGDLKIQNRVGYVYGKIDYLSKRPNHADEKVIGVLLMLSGDIHGMILLIFHQHFIEKKLRLTMGRQCDYNNLKEEELTCIEETASIISSVYLETLSTYIPASIKIHMPATVFDMKGAILNDALGYMQEESQMLYMEHHYWLDDDPTEENQILFMVDQKSAHLILKALGVL